MHKSPIIGGKKGAAVAGARPRRCRRGVGNGASTGLQEQNSGSGRTNVGCRNMLRARVVGELSEDVAEVR